jgi:hypothetical protein
MGHSRLLLPRAPAGLLRAASGVGLEASPREARAKAEALAAAALTDPRIVLGLPDRGLPLVRVMRPDALRVLRGRARELGLPEVDRVARLGLLETLERQAARRAAALAEASSRRVNLCDTGAPTRRSARRWRTADGGEPHIAASPVPPGPAPRPVGVGRVRCVAVVP